MAVLLLRFSLSLPPPNNAHAYACMNINNSYGHVDSGKLALSCRTTFFSFCPFGLSLTYTVLICLSICDISPRCHIKGVFRIECL